MMEKPYCLDDVTPEPTEAEACPSDCTSWFDGCNTCSCEAGVVTGCTKKLCPEQMMQEARCLDEPEVGGCPSDCSSWFDGCNTCICNNGEIAACTYKWCPENMMEEARCLDATPEPTEAIGCPSDCSSWFDGCNTCTCNNGELGACTMKWCFTQEEPRCLDEPDIGECQSDCTSWFDGCNTCTCEEGKIGMCTMKWCAVQGIPRCLDESTLEPVAAPTLEPEPECPSDCTSWFDGCNTCVCAEGMVIGCTKKFCAPEMMEEAMCLDDIPEPECPSDCSSWYDGCNTCTCNEGKIGACTERWCFQQEEPASDCPSNCTTWFDGCNTC